MAAWVALLVGVLSPGGDRLKYDPQDYLAKIYGSRALFKLLYAEGMSVLPPLMPDDEKHWPIESTRSQRDLAVELGIGASTVGVDMRRLENWGWVQKKRGRRLLGHRRQARVLLIADATAEAATGVPRLVSTEVLGISQAVQDAGVDAVAEAKPGAVRGTMRQWDPNDA